MSEQPKHGTAMETVVPFEDIDVTSENGFEVTVDGLVVSGDKEVWHKPCEILRNNIDISVDGLKPKDGIRVHVYDDSADQIGLTSYGLKSDVYDVVDAQLAGQIKDAWRDTTALQPGETVPVITEQEARTLKNLLLEVPTLAEQQNPLGALCKVPYNEKGRCEDAPNGDQVWKR